MILLAHAAVAVLAALVSRTVFERFGAPTGWCFYPLAAFVIGTRFRAVGNMIHEACHGTLVKGHRANVIFGHLLCAIDLSCFSSYRHDHFTHHRHLGDPAKDHDFRSRLKFGFGGEDEAVSWKHILVPLSLSHLSSYLRPVVWSKADPTAANVLKILLLAVLALSAHFLSVWTPLVLYYAIPYAVAYQILKYWSDAFDHAGIMTSPDEFDRTRNHVFAVNLANRFLFPRNDEYHLVHHLFPSVPTTLQKKVHAILMRDHEYRLREHTALGMFRRQALRRHAQTA
jgi:fatty acid desaturase